MSTITTKNLIENLPNNSKVTGFTHCVTITAKNLAETTAGTADVFTVPIPAKSSIKDVLVDLRTPFANSGDDTNNSTTLTVGDTSSATKFISSTEVNANGTAVPMARSSGTPAVYGTANTFKITITPKAETVLAGVLNKGEVNVYFNLVGEGELG